MGLSSISSSYQTLSSHSKKYYLNFDSKKDAFVWKNKKDQDGEALFQLQTQIGFERFKRICKRHHIHDLSSLREDTVEKILIGIGDIRKKDLKVISEDKILPKEMEEIDVLYDQLLLSLTVEEMFFRKNPNVYKNDKRDIDYSAGKGLHGLRSRTWIILKFREQCMKHNPKEDLKTIAEDVEYFTSRLIDREPPKGCVIRLHKGYFYNDHTLIAKGAYVNIYKGFDSEAPALISCRGSRLAPRATSAFFTLINDLLPHLGSLAARSVWADLKTYLEKEEIDQVEISGKSMGGSLAQYLTVLVHGKTDCTVSRLTTYCSPGTPRSVQEIYEKSSHKKKRPKIFVIRNSGSLKKFRVDFVPAMGGRHLRNKKNKKTHVCYIVPPKHKKHAYKFPLHIPYKSKLNHFINSFNDSHLRQACLDKYKVCEVKKKNRERELNVGKGLETTRKVVSWIFTIMTLGIFHKKFEAFYESLP